MLWPIVLPLKLTVVALLVITLLVTLVAAVSKRRVGRTFLVAVVVSILAFVPVCATISSVLDRYRFGTFQYATFEKVDDFRVERYLPPAASDITLDKQPQGFRARFRIAPNELNRFLDDVWTQYGDRSVVSRSELASSDSTGLETHRLNFGDLGWPVLADAEAHSGPIAGNGAGFTIWYSPEAGIAYQRGAYW